MCCFSIKQAYVLAVVAAIGQSLVPCLSQVWDVLQPLECPDQLKPSGHLQQQQLKQHTAAIKALDCVGPVVQPHSVCKVVVQIARLRQWQQQSGLGAVSSGKASAAAAAVTSLSKQMAGLDLLAEEYGSHLAVTIPEGSAALSWFFGSSNSSLSAQQQGQQRSDGLGGAAAVGGELTATPAELRQIFAAEAAGDDLGWAGGVAEHEAEDDVDIDSDDERKGRGKRVSQFVFLTAFGFGGVGRLMYQYATRLAAVAAHPVQQYRCKVGSRSACCPGRHRCRLRWRLNRLLALLLCVLLASRASTSSRRCQPLDTCAHDATPTSTAVCSLACLLRR